eukprot:CAMPEP_0182458956 /NCGR_PEP_ID=MMETSP1319-20130603/4178_1 /TAXON_ID=172717 /ORGANISM="Bolidomonas pacifica, Strain RCC208" /LENGTH=68 /DNA_ID=CAMNT_0024657747 /DNA_START=143 /DNA_END=346 /DNA_ORIENTATION=+
MSEMVKRTSTYNPAVLTPLGGGGVQSGGGEQSEGTAETDPRDPPKAADLVKRTSTNNPAVLTPLGGGG